MLRGHLVLRVLPLLLCVLLPGCGAPAGARDTTGQDVRRAVAAWSRVPPERLAGIPLEDWSYEVGSVRRDGARATARAALRYRLAGYDSAPGGTERELTLAEDGGKWRVTADRPAPGALPQLWDQGPVTVVPGAHSLVLGGEGLPAGTLAGIAAEAERAVPAASAAWPRPWAGRVVVLVPGSLERMAELLGRPAAEYRGMGAVTTGRVGAGPAPADRVVVNPQAYPELSAQGRRIILTHEVTHVATRAATSATTPLWLSEGFADWAAYREGGATPAQAAPTLARAVRRGGLPAALPPTEAFAFGGDAEALARAYEGAWLACRLIAERWGEDGLVRLYEAAGRDPLPVALPLALGTDVDTLTRAWQEYLRTELR
uniref:Lipoprotein n=1 Tax=Streptomyces sp. NBC_00049 TaxID=2903617 RepID=A0AAU2JMN0_9ACTN